jgi:hypothetical protein
MSRHTEEQNQLPAEDKLRKKRNDLLKEALKMGNPKEWMRTTEEIINEIKTGTRNHKDGINRIQRQRFHDKMKEEASKKSKGKHYLQSQEEKGPGRRKKYMEKGSRFTTSNIIMARSRMIEVKMNYKN